MRNSKSALEADVGISLVRVGRESLALDTKFFSFRTDDVDDVEEVDLVDANESIELLYL
jgi:hypothetical protein